MKTRIWIGLVVVGATMCWATAASADSEVGKHRTAAANLGVPQLSLSTEAVLPASASALTDPDYRRRYYKKRIHRTTVPVTEIETVETRRTVVVEEVRPQRVVVHRPSPRVRPPVREDDGLSLSVRTTGISFGERKLSQGSLDGDEVAGLGVAFRYNLEPNWGLEFAVDIASGEGEIAEVTTIPVSASLFARLFPESRLDLYGLAGAGLHFTKQDYHFDVADDQYMQVAGHLGVGSELKLGQFLVIGDLRWLFMQAPPTTVPQPNEAREPEEESTKAEPRFVREEIQDDVINGLQFTLGVGYRW